MKFISLFAGVGGFDLGMERAGHECVAQVEWDKNAAGVLKRRWPDVPLFCDVSKVTGADLPDCDFLTYGFPCQDLSVAGKREGLEGDRSGLFFEATRLIRELVGRGSGLRFALAENVAGLFSADDGLAFARCLRELLDCGANETGWRLCDSQYFGVAQRRRRVFIISDFGGESCDEVLAVTESLRGHPAPRREAGQGVAADAGGGFAPGSFGGYEPGVGTLRSEGGDLGGGSETLAVGCDVYNGEETGETAATVTSATGIANASGPKVMGFSPYQGSAAQSLGAEEENAPTLRGNGRMSCPAVCHETPASGPKVMSIGLDQEQNGDVELCGTLKAKENSGGFEGSVCSWNGDETPKSSEEVCLTLRAGQGGEGVGVAHGVAAFGHNTQVEVDKMPPLRAGDDRGNTSFMAQNLTVRRLTCRECERLQGFPDDWTSEKAEVELAGNEWQATGKVAKQADGPRYKQMGNAVTVNVAAWFGGRLANVEKSEGESKV